MMTRFFFSLKEQKEVTDRIEENIDSAQTSVLNGTKNMITVIALQRGFFCVIKTSIHCVLLFRFKPAIDVCDAEIMIAFHWSKYSQYERKISDTFLLLHWVAVLS